MSIMRIILAAGLLSGSLHAGSWPHSASHLDQDPRDHVVLRREAGVLNGCGLQSSDFFRIRPDGAKDDSAFRVPEGRLLVVTDVDWWIADFRRPIPGPDNDRNYFGLALQHDYGDGHFSEYPVFQDVQQVDFQGRRGNSVAMTTGFVVGPDTPICPYAQLADTPDTDVLRMDVLIRGYLIKDRRHGYRAKPASRK